jgi:hypothetical protein
MQKRVYDLILLAPVIGAIAFTAVYALSNPLTDEWLLLRNAMIAHDNGWSDPSATLGAMTWKIYDHPLVIPNLIYLGIEPLFDFDTRALVAITLAAYAAVLVVFRSRIAKTWWAAFPAAVILFSPSHYMEYIWGFQFALAMSWTLPVIGLALFAGGRPASSTRAFGMRLAGTLGLITLGILSSASGAFGFLALAVLAGLKSESIFRKGAVASIGIAAFIVAYVIMRPNGNIAPFPDLRDIYAFFTAIGSCLVGSPVGVTAFSFDTVSVLGILVCLIAAASLGAALWVRALDDISLSFAIFVYGAFCVAAVVLSRNYVGNWRLTLALPVVLGAFGCALSLSQRPVKSANERSFPASAVSGAALAILAFSSIGYADGWKKRGREYHDYAKTVGDYMDH